MSIKRSKTVSHGRGRQDDMESPFRRAKPIEPEKSWAEHMEGRPPEAFLTYSPGGHYTNGALLAHATFGRGVVVASVDRRIDVLFEGGKKTLTHAG